MSRIKSYTIALIYHPFNPKSQGEVSEIKTALESYGNTITVFKATKELVLHLKKNSADIAFNLARNQGKAAINRSISAICELLNIPIIGPNVFAAELCNNPEMLHPILKYDRVPIMPNLDPHSSSNLLQAFLLGTECQKFFLIMPPEMNPDISHRIAEICKKSFKSIHGSDYGQFTIFLENSTTPYLTEINPMPFLGKNSNFAKLVNLQNINYPDFINIILMNALIRHKLPLPANYESLKKNL